MNSPDHQDDDLEKALVQLKPASLPKAVRSRLDAVEPKRATAEQPETTGNNWIRILLRLAIPGIAAAAIASVVFRPNDNIGRVETPLPVSVAKRAADSVNEQIFTPIETNQVVLAAEELALLPGPHDRPVQLMRIRVLDYERSRAKDGSEILVATPREQVIPVTLTAY